ncbi:MAG TPA: hypothetical protein VGM59_10290 [Dongiaceae bacterium]
MLPIAARYGGYRLKTITGPIVLGSVEGEQVVRFATLEGRLRLAYTSADPLPGLLERIEAELDAAVTAQ